MDFNKLKIKYPEDLIVFIEEINKDEEYVIIDFYDSNEFRTFCTLINQDYFIRPSMIIIYNYEAKHLSEDTYYRVKQEVITEWVNKGLITQIKNSFLLGYRIDLLSRDTAIFSESVSFNSRNYDYLDYIFPGIGVQNIKFEKVKGCYELVVRNVGSGNWNEINVNGETKFVFDCGAPTNASDIEVRNIIGSKVAEYKKSKPILILSHWDKDHYHSLLGMTDGELSIFNTFIYRNFNFNYTSRILLGRILRVVKYTIGMDPEQPIKRGLPYFLRKSCISDQINLYNASQHKNRNISGLVLTIKTSKSSTVLTGDAYYKQISQSILPDLNYKCQHYLVVPHHGGNAGPYIYDLGKKMNPNKAIISVGKNIYCHPRKYNIQNLKTSHFEVKRTDFDGEIRILL